MTASSSLQRLIALLQKLAPEKGPSQLEAHANDIAWHALLHLRSDEAMSNRSGKYNALKKITALNGQALKLGMSLAWDALGTEAFRAVEAHLRSRGSPSLEEIQTIM